jgi:hypothetical protein
MVEELNEDLEALTEWLKNNKLQLNSTKSVAILITTSQIIKQKIINSHPNVKIKLDGYVLELCDKVKYLGIIIDSMLKLHEHIIYTANKGGYSGTLGRTFKPLHLSRTSFLHFKPLCSNRPRLIYHSRPMCLKSSRPYH